jgi:hypothetical protein
LAAVAAQVSLLAVWLLLSEGNSSQVPPEEHCSKWNPRKFGIPIDTAVVDRYRDTSPA